MKTIVIPGYSTKNKDWADEVKRKLPDVEVHEWAHWTNPETKFSVENEVENITKKLGQGNVNIIAKSIGTYVFVNLVKRNLDRFEKIILCGICKNDLNNDELSKYHILNEIDPKNIIVLQNSEDEHGSFEEVRKFLSQINPEIKIMEKPGRTHDYPYYDEFEKFLS